MFNNKNLKVRIVPAVEEVVISKDLVLVEEDTKKAKIRMGNDYEIINSVQLKNDGESQYIINEHYLLFIKRRVLRIFTDKEMIQNTLNIDEVIIGINERLMPIITKYLIYIISMNKIYSHVLNIYMNEISSIIFGYIKLEFMYHSLVFSNIPIKTQIDSFMDEIVNDIHGEQA